MNLTKGPRWDYMKKVTKVKKGDPINEMWGYAALLAVYWLGLYATGMTAWTWATGFPVGYFFVEVCYLAYKVIKGGGPEGTEN